MARRAAGRVRSPRRSELGTLGGGQGGWCGAGCSGQRGRGRRSGRDGGGCGGGRGGGLGSGRGSGCGSGRGARGSRQRAAAGSAAGSAVSAVAGAAAGAAAPAPQASPWPAVSFRVAVGVRVMRVGYVQGVILASKLRLGPKIFLRGSAPHPAGGCPPPDPELGTTAFWRAELPLSADPSAKWSHSKKSVIYLPRIFI